MSFPVWAGLAGLLGSADDRWPELDCHDQGNHDDGGAGQEPAQGVGPPGILIVSIAVTGVAQGSEQQYSLELSVYLFMIAVSCPTMRSKGEKNFQEIFQKMVGGG